MIRFIYDMIKNMDTSGVVVEIGSKVYEGQDITKDVVSGDHIGIDMFAGKNVDLVCSSHSIDLSDNFADLVIATSILEHDPAPKLTIKEIRRILKPNGRLFITVPFNWPIHGYPDDYWRYTPLGLKKLFAECGLNIRCYGIGHELNPHTVIGLMNLNIDCDEISKKYPAPEGRRKHFFNMLTPQFIIRAIKFIMHGRTV